MKRLYFIALTLFICSATFAQSPYQYPEALFNPRLSPEFFYKNKIDKNVSHNPGLQYRLNTGMSFASLSGFNSIISFVSPKVFIPVGRKFAFEVETTFSTSSFYGDNEDFPERINNLIVTATGIYAVNEKLTLYGQYSKSLLKPNELLSNNFEKITMGFEYYLTPNLSFGASITSQQGYDPFYMGGMPFGNAPVFGRHY